jgi:energy-coupling factor transporter transmembrane protein EcfT
VIAKKREFLHSWYVFLISLASLLFLLLNKVLLLDLFLLTGTIAIFLKNGLRYKQLLKIGWYAFIFSLCIFLLNRLHPGPDATLAKALFMAERLFFVSFFSMSAGAAIDYTRVLMHLMVQKRLKLFLGYPILLAINSIALFKDEFERIKINARLRELPIKDKLSLFFPLLVFAIRHSQRGALSLVTRGLNQKKSFYFTYDVSAGDKQLLFLFWIFYFGLVSLTQVKLG